MQNYFLCSNFCFWSKNRFCRRILLPNKLWTGLNILFRRIFSNLCFLFRCFVFAPFYAFVNFLIKKNSLTNFPLKIHLWMNASNILLLLCVFFSFVFVCMFLTSPHTFYLYMFWIFNERGEKLKKNQILSKFEEFG